MAMVALAQLVGLPLVVLYSLWVERSSNRARWWSTAALTTSCVLFILIAGAWGWVGYWLRIAVALALVGCFIRSYRRRGGSLRVDTASWKFRLDTAVRLVASAVFAVGVVQALRGYAPGASSVELDFPLRGGVYLVGQGGASPFINYHNVNPSQRYALDLLRLNRLSARAAGLYPKDLSKYAIYGQPIHSPCTGTVAWARDGMLDLTPPDADRQHVAGNHVVVECQGVSVHLSHFRRGSVAVARQDSVRSGQLIGRVGNSGNTSEPHLHIHAERGRYRAGSPPGTGVPIRFEGRFLVRNSLVFAD